MSKPEIPTAIQLENAGRVIPLLAETVQTPTLLCYDRSSPARGRLETMVYDVFKCAYNAELREFSEYLIGLEYGEHLSGVAGVRLASEGALFSERYIDQPVEALISERNKVPVERSQIVEIGNLAVPSAGEARKLFAGLSAFLHTAGFEWVLFTAIMPLYANFQRMGFKPQIIGDALLHRVGRDSGDWGSYYELSPKVCIGSVALGHQHMQAGISSRQPSLSRFWSQAAEEGERFARGSAANAVRGYWA